MHSATRINAHKSPDLPHAWFIICNIDCSIWLVHRARAGSPQLRHLDPEPSEQPRGKWETDHKWGGGRTSLRGPRCFDLRGRTPAVRRWPHRGVSGTALPKDTGRRGADLKSPPAGGAGDAAQGAREVGPPTPFWGIVGMLPPADI